MKTLKQIKKLKEYAKGKGDVFYYEALKQIEECYKKDIFSIANLEDMN